MPEISVIVPVYKAEKYLDDCISSIANQTYKDFELILVPAKSDDICTSICEKWAKADQRIRIIDQDRPSVSYARNKGIKNAKGIYIAFCDADDIYLPTYLEKMHSKITSCNADIVECNFFHATEDLKVKKIFDSFDAISFFSHDFYERFGAVSVWKYMSKKELWTQNSISFPEIQLGEDLAIYSLIFSLSRKSVFVNEPLYIYRDVPKSLSKQLKTNPAESLSSFENLFEYIVSEFKRVNKFEENRLKLSSLSEHHSVAAYDSLNVDASDKFSQIIKKLTNVNTTIWDLNPLGWGTHLTGVLCQVLSKSPDVTGRYIRDMSLTALNDEGTRVQFAELARKEKANIYIIDLITELKNLEIYSFESCINGFISGLAHLINTIETSIDKSLIIFLKLSIDNYLPEQQASDLRQLFTEYYELIFTYIKLNYPGIRIIDPPNVEEGITIPEKLLSAYYYESIMDIIHLL